MTDQHPSATHPSPGDVGTSPGLDTAALLDAGLEPARAPIDRWTPPAPTELAGSFPNLEVIALVGVGGMGAVYRARQTHLDRTVALKLLSPVRVAVPGFAERFAREARAMARLDHPNIVRLHDFGSASGYHYLVMEFIEGATLRQVVSTGRLSAGEALRLVPQLCNALSHAHSAGVVHRDLKPENIMIDGHGQAHIADFGLAKLAGDREGLTEVGQVLGTIHYMAPEQLSASADVDHRADLYALGVVAYEMLTGALPLGRFDPPSRTSGVASGVDDVVMRSLERDPERRYRDAAELRDALERANGGGAQTPQDAPGPRASAPAGDRPQSVDVGGIHVGPDGVRIGSWINIRSGDQPVRDREVPGPAERPIPRAEAGELPALHHAGMTAVLAGGAIGLLLAMSHLMPLIHAPDTYFAAKQPEALALLATPSVIVGGIALLMRCMLAAVITSAVASLLYLPWAWQGGWWTFIPALIAIVWYVDRVRNFAPLRAHMSSLAPRARLLRLPILTTLLVAALGAPLLLLL
jgi:hypothetical protein